MLLLHTLIKRSAAAKTHFRSTIMKNIQKLHLISFSYGVNFTTTIFTLYLLFHSITLQQIIISQILYALASFIGEIPSGMLSDKLGHKKLVTVAYGMFIFSPLVILIAPSAFTLYIGQIINGLAGAALSGSQEALYFDSYQEEGREPKDYKKSFSRFSSLPILGFILSSGIAGIMLQLLGNESYNLLYLFNIFSTVITTIIATTLFETRRQSEIEDSSPLVLFKESMRTIKNNKLLFSLATFGLLSLNGEYLLRQTYQPHFEVAGVLPLFFGLALAFGAVLNFLSIRYSYKLEKYLKLEQILLLHSFLQGILFIVLGSLKLPWVLVTLFILLFGMFNAQNPIVSDYVNSRVESKNRATVLSSISFIRQLGQTLIRFVYAFIIGMLSIGSVYILQGAYLLIGGLIGYWLLVRCGCSHKISHMG